MKGQWHRESEDILGAEQGGGSSLLLQHPGPHCPCALMPLTPAKESRGGDTQEDDIAPSHSPEAPV